MPAPRPGGPFLGGVGRLEGPNWGGILRLRLRQGAASTPCLGAQPRALSLGSGVPLAFRVLFCCPGYSTARDPGAPGRGLSRTHRPRANFCSQALTAFVLPAVRQFLESGVSPDLANEDGLTALHQVSPAGGGRGGQGCGGGSDTQAARSAELHRRLPGDGAAAPGGWGPGQRPRQRVLDTVARRSHLWPPAPGGAAHCSVGPVGSVGSQSGHLSRAGAGRTFPAGGSSCGDSPGFSPGSPSPLALACPACTPVRTAGAWQRPGCCLRRELARLRAVWPSACGSSLRAGFDLPLWLSDLPRFCTEMPLWSESQGRNWQGDTWTLVGPLMGRAEQGWAPEHLPW